MDENHQRRHEIAMIGLRRSYGLLTKILADVPLPIRLQPLGESIYADEVETGLVHAWYALRDVPMDEEVQDWIGILILDWIVACGFLFDDEEVEAEWHLALVEIQIARIIAGSDLVTERLRSLEE